MQSWFGLTKTFERNKGASWHANKRMNRELFLLCAIEIIHRNLYLCNENLKIDNKCVINT
uniref:Uncharacterized protein n=1 Tax=Romanomermis culicivorax TaxID=13658 RepID=A0A915IMQ1_ROMCU